MQIPGHHRTPSLCAKENFLQRRHSPTHTPLLLGKPDLEFPFTLILEPLMGPRELSGRLCAAGQKVVPPFSSTCPGSSERHIRVQRTLQPPPAPDFPRAQTPRMVCRGCWQDEHDPTAPDLQVCPAQGGCGRLLFACWWLLFVAWFPSNPGVDSISPASAFWEAKKASGSILTVSSTYFWCWSWQKKSLWSNLEQPKGHSKSCL